MDNEEKQKKLEIGRELAAAFVKKKHGANTQNRKKKAEKVGQEWEKGSQVNAKEQTEKMPESFQMKELENLEETDVPNEKLPTNRNEGLSSFEETDTHVLARLQTRIKELEDIVEGKNVALEAARLQLHVQNTSEVKPCDASCGQKGCGVQDHAEEYSTKMLEFKSALEQRDSIIQKLSNSLKDALSTRDELQLKGEHLAQEVSSLNKQLQSTKELIQNQQRNSEIRSEDFELLKNQKLALEEVVQNKDLIINGLNETIFEKDNTIKMKEVELHSKCLELNSEKTRTAEEIRSLMLTVETEHKEKAAALQKLQSLEELHEAAMSDLRIKMEETFGLQLGQIKEELRLQFEKEKQVYCNPLNSKTDDEQCNQISCKELRSQNELLLKKVNDYNLQLRAFEENILSLNLTHCGTAMSNITMDQDENECKESTSLLLGSLHEDVKARNQKFPLIEDEHTRQEEGELTKTVFQSYDTEMKQKKILLELLACQREVEPLKEHLKRLNSMFINVCSVFQNCQKNIQLADMPKENRSEFGADNRNSVDSLQNDISIYNKGDAVIELETDLHWISNVNTATQEIKSTNSSTECCSTDSNQIHRPLEEVIKHMSECTLEKCVNILHVNDFEGEITHLKTDLVGLNNISSLLRSKLDLCNMTNKEEFAVQHLMNQGLEAAREEMESELKHCIQELEKDLSQVQAKLNETQSENLNLKSMISCISNISKKVKQEGFNKTLLKEVRQVFQHIDEMFSNNSHICTDHTQFIHILQEKYTEQLMKRVQDLENTLQQVNEESDTIKQESVKMICKVTQAKEMSEKLKHEMRSLKEENCTLRQVNEYLTVEIGRKDKLLIELQSMKDDLDNKSLKPPNEDDSAPKLPNSSIFHDGDTVKQDLVKNDKCTESASRWIQYLKLAGDYRKVCGDNNELTKEIQKLKLQLDKLNNSKSVIEDKVQNLDRDLHSKLEKLSQCESTIQNITKDKMEIENKICLLEYEKTSFEEKINEYKQETNERLLNVETKMSDLCAIFSDSKVLSYTSVINVLKESCKNAQDIVSLKEKFFIQEHTISRLNKEIELLQKLNTEKNHKFQTLHNEFLLLQKKFESSCTLNQIKEKEIAEMKNHLIFHQAYEDSLETERKQYIDNNKMVEEIVGSVVTGDTKIIMEELVDEIISLRQVFGRVKPMRIEPQQQEKYENFEHSVQQAMDTTMRLQERTELLMGSNEQLITEKELLLASICNLPNLQTSPDANQKDYMLALLNGYQNEVISELATYRNQNSTLNDLRETAVSLHETLIAQKEKYLWKIQTEGGTEDKLEEYKEKKKVELELQLLRTEMSARESILLALKNQKEKLESELKEVNSHLQEEKLKQEQQKIVFDDEIRCRDLCIQHWQIECKAVQALLQTSSFEEYLKIISSTDILTWHYLEQQRLESLSQKLKDAHSSEINKWKSLFQEHLNMCHSEVDQEQQCRKFDELPSMLHNPVSNVFEPLFQRETWNECQDEKLYDPNILLNQCFRQFQHIISGYYSSFVKKLIGKGMKCEEEKVNKITREIETMQDEVNAMINSRIDNNKMLDLTSVGESIKTSLKAKEVIVDELKRFHNAVSSNYLEQINTLRSSLNNSCSKIVKDIQKWGEESELVRLLKAQVENLEKEKLELEHKHRCAVDLLSHEHEVEIAKLRDLIVGIKCEDSSTVDEVRQELEAKYTKEVEELRQYFEQKVAEVEKHYSEEIISQHSRKLSTSSCESENEIYYSGAGDHGSRLPPLTPIYDPSVVEPQYGEQHEGNIELMSEKKHLTDYQNQLKALKKELKRKYSAEAELLKLDYEVKVESVVRDLSAIHKGELAQLEMKYDQKILDTFVKCEAKIKNLKSQFENTEKAKHEQKISTLKQKHVEDITILKKQFIESLEKKTRYLTAILQNVFTKYISSVKSLLEAHRKKVFNCDYIQKIDMQDDNICDSQIHLEIETFGEFITKELEFISRVPHEKADNMDFLKQEREFIAAVLHQIERNFVNCNECFETEISYLWGELEKQKKHYCQLLEDRHKKELDQLKCEMNELRRQVNSAKTKSLHNTLQQTDITMPSGGATLGETLPSQKESISDNQMEGMGAAAPCEYEKSISDPPSEYETKEDENNTQQKYVTLVNQLQSEIQQKDDSHSRTICEIKRMHEYEVESLKFEYDRRVEQAKHEIFKALEEQIQALLASDDDTPKPKELMLLQEKLNVHYQREIEEIRENHASEIENLKLEYQKIIEDLKVKCKNNLQVETIHNSLVDETLHTSSDSAHPKSESCSDNEILRIERDSLRKMGEKLRYLVEELVQYCSVCEEELNYAVIEKLMEKQNLNDSTEIDKNEQSLLLDKSDLTSLDSCRYTDLSTHSLGNIANLETSSEKNNLECNSDDESELSIPPQCTETKGLPVIRKVHFAPNISSIVNLHDESSFMQFIEENKDWSVNIRNELNSCLRRLRKEASALFGLSTALPGHLTAANAKTQSLESKLTTLSDELSNEAQEKEHLLEKINELIAKNENLMEDLNSCKIRINELESERQIKEFVSEGIGENVHSPLTRQMENLAKLQDRARSVLNEATDQRNSPYMHLLEELCKEGDRLTEEARKEREDLQLQVEAADKLLRSTRQFLEEQAAEREQERDEFIQEIRKLQERLLDRDKDRDDYERLIKEVEALEFQLKEAQKEHEEQTSKKEELESELKAAVDKIWVLREIITDLEQQVTQHTQREAELEQRVESLQAVLQQQTQNHQRLAEELHSLQLDSGSIELTQHINHLEEELQKHRQHVEQLQSNSTVIQEMRTQLQELEALVDKKTKDLESLFVTTCSISCSSPSEDVSIREQIDDLRCDTPEDAPSNETPLMLPLAELYRLQEKILRHSKTDEVALKRVHDLEMQLQVVRRNEEEVVAERDLLQEKVEQQLVKISSLESLRDEHRRTVKNIQEKASIELQSKIYDTENTLRILKETLDEKNSEVKDLKTTLENMREALTLQETEWVKKLSAEREKLLSLQNQTEKLLQEKEQLQAALSEHVKEMNTSIPELLSTVLSEKNTEIDSLTQQLADLQKQFEEQGFEKQDQQLKVDKTQSQTELSNHDAEQTVLLDEVDGMRECEEPTFVTNTASFQAHCNEMHKPQNLGNESSATMKHLELAPTEEFSLEMPVPNFSDHVNSEELFADKIFVSTIEDQKLDSINTNPEISEVDVKIESTDHIVLYGNEQNMEQLADHDVHIANSNAIFIEKLKQTVKCLKQEVESKNDKILEYQKKLEEMLMLREERKSLETQLISAVKEIATERNNFHQEKQLIKECELKLKCEVTNLKTLIDEKQSEMNYLKGIIISKDEIIKQLEEDNKMMFTPDGSISHRLSETKELDVLLIQLKEEQESVKALKNEVNRLQDLNGKIVNEYNNLRKDLEKNDANSLDDLTGRVEKELDLSARLDSSLLEKLEPLEGICKCNDPSFISVIGKMVKFGTDILSLEELSFLRHIVQLSGISKDRTSFGMVAAPNIGVPDNKLVLHENNIENLSKQLSLQYQQKVEQLESTVETGKKQVMELLESLNKQKAYGLELEKKVNELMRFQTEYEMENENLKRQTMYHEERLQQFIVLLEKERVKVRDFENDLHKEKNNVRHLQSLLETERQRASDTNRKDSELIESMRIKLENALDNEMRLRIQFDQAVSNQEALKSQLKCQQLKTDAVTVSRDSNAVITLKDKCAKLETVVRQEQRKINHLQTTLEEERLSWQQKLESEKSVVQQLRTDVVILKTQKDGLDNQLHAAQEQIATHQMDIEALGKKVRSLKEAEIASQRRYIAACQEADKARRLLEHAHSLQLELERKVVTLEQQLCASSNEGNGEEIAQLQHENAELHRLLSASRLHASELSRQLQAAEAGKDCPEPVLLKLKSVNTTLEKHVNDNAELTQKLSQLLEERQKLQRKISDMQLQMQKVISQLQTNDLEKRNLDAKFTAERVAWTQERTALQLALAQAKAEIEMPIGAEAMKDTEQRVNHLFGKYLRAESFRKSLIWQKRYLLVVLDGYEDTESSTLRKLNHLGKSIKNVGPVQYHRSKTPKTSFKSAALVVVAIHRMKYLVKRWKYGRLIGGSTVLGRAYSESVIGASAIHGPRRWGSTSSNIWASSHSQGVQSPPSRDSPTLSNWQLNRAPSHAASLPEGANQVLAYIDRFDTIQQQLGLGMPRKN